MVAPKLERVSYSLLHSLACDYASFLRYEGGLKGPVTSYMALGNALHFALEKFHLEQDVGLDFLFKKFEIELERILEVDEVFITFPQKKKFLAEGKIMLNTYFVQMNDGKFPRHPLDVEKEFKLDIAGIQIVGKIDRVDQDTSGNLTLVDYKSGSKKPDDWILRHNLQFTAYYWACKEIYGKYPTKIIWHHLKTGEFLQTERTEWDVDQLKIIVENAVKMRDMDIRHRIYHEQVCQWCPFVGDICDSRELEAEVLARRGTN